MFMRDEHTENADIETVFRQRWLKTERFFSPTWSSREWLRPMLHFTHALREKGYHKKLRAGTSLYDFVLSRSAKHGLRRGQARIRFMLNREGGMEIIYQNRDEVVRFQQDSSKVTPEIEMLLDKLIQEPIN